MTSARLGQRRHVADSRLLDLDLPCSISVLPSRRRAQSWRAQTNQRLSRAMWRSTFAAVVAFTLLFQASHSASQTKNESIGAATGQYWGALVLIESLSRSRCASQLSLHRSDFDLISQRALIEKRVDKFLSASERAEFRRLLDEGEAEVRGLFRGLNLESVTHERCRAIAMEFTSLYRQRKSVWEQVVR